MENSTLPGAVQPSSASVATTEPSNQYDRPLMNTRVDTTSMMSACMPFV